MVLLNDSCRNDEGLFSVWIHLACVVLTAISLLSCSHSKDPQEAFDHAAAALKRGDVGIAGSEAELAYNQFHERSAEWAWKFTILRAKISYRQARYEDALKILTSEKSVAPSNVLAIRGRWLEGLSYMSLGNLSQSEQTFNVAEQICGDVISIECGDVLTARGTLEMNRGHYSQAQVWFERVLNDARASGNPSWQADALLDMSWCANEQTHFDAALDWSNEARQIAVSRGFPAVNQAAVGNIAWAYYKLGELEKAEGMFAEAQQQAQKLEDWSDTVKWLTNEGYAFMDEGKPEAATPSFLQSLDRARKIKSRNDIINSLIALAFVSEQTGKIDDAKRYSDEALRMALEDGNKRDQTYPLLTQGRIAAQQHDVITAEAALNEVAQSPDSPVFLKWEAQRSLARLYADGNHLDQADRQYRTALSTFEAARCEVKHEDSRLPFLTNAAPIYDDYIHFLIKQGKTEEALQVADYGRARTMREGLGILKCSTTFHPDPVNASQIARKFGGTVLFYWLGQNDSFLWAITPQKISLFTIPKTSEIEPLVQRYRKALIDLQDSAAVQNSEGIALYQTLIAPAQSMLPKNGKVFVVPDGSLNTLSFETLLAPDPKPHYWIEDVSVTDASSLRMLAAARPEQKRTGGLLLLGNSISPSPDYPELRNAPEEMDNIAKHFAGQQQQAFARDQATPSAYLNGNPGNYSFIHFVAHGTASRLSPLDSAIVLSKANAQDDSFKLYARDIVQHPLHADLVTISTCYGAGSRAYSGEGLVGLSWAFLRAGAHNVIGALWEVSDVSTPELMDQLYTGLHDGKAPDAALREAKLAMLHSNSAFHKPFYWAPFQLYTGS